MEGLHAAVENLGEARHGADVGHRQAGLAKRPRRAAGRHQLEPAADEAAPQLGQAALVAHGQERPARRRHARSAVGGSMVEAPAVDATAPASSSATARGSSRCSTALIRSCKASSSSPGRIGTASWSDDRTAVERLVDDVNGAAGDLRAVGDRVAHGVRPRERRQQRRVGVQDPARERGEHRRADEAHVACEDDHVGRG